ncbi:ParA family protein [Pseudomonas sichuanensis]|uniref:ParA family protein n=1 Tax=Pseudomonas sichuanensis TaxID=2213015 RepID=UPI002B40217E|nr:AAA family ATPase [Pseudomonas sichuanensis]
MAKETRKQTPVLAVVNMKGGVGKTTISAHLFREFYRKKAKNVLLIDFDPQFNLTQALFDQSDYEVLKSQGSTILSVMESAPELSIFNTCDSDGKPADVSVIRQRLKKAAKSNGEGVKPTYVYLDIIPGDFDLSKYSLIDDKNILGLAGRRFKAFIDKAKEEYDLICIDCNPSTSFLNMCALRSATHLLVPVKPDRYSMLGLRLLDNFVNGLVEITVKPKKIIILNGIPRSKYDPTVENELRSDPVYGPMTMVTKLNTSDLLVANPNYTGFATDKNVAYTKALRDKFHLLSDELTVALGLK